MSKLKNYKTTAKVSVSYSKYDKKENKVVWIESTEFISGTTLAESAEKAEYSFKLSKIDEYKQANKKLFFVEIKTHTV